MPVIVNTPVVARIGFDPDRPGGQPISSEQAVDEALTALQEDQVTKHMD